jgi:hypothetical protein
MSVSNQQQKLYLIMTIQWSKPKFVSDIKYVRCNDIQTEVDKSLSIHNPSYNLLCREEDQKDKPKSQAQRSP